MNFKKFLKTKLGDKYHQFYLKNILRLIFGRFYPTIKDFLKKIFPKFDFIKKDLSKKIEHQRIIKSEPGLIIDLTKKNYLTYHLRPKYSKDFNLESTYVSKDKIAIIIQGPINEKFNFLKNTLSIYKKLFKNCLIIISTWKNENINLISSLKDRNTFILFNEEPKKSQKNINHQIISTNKALEFAFEKGAKYSIKTRADVRICKNNLESF